MAEKEGLIESSGNFGMRDNSLICQFIHALNAVNKTVCIDYELDICLS